MLDRLKTLLFPDRDEAAPDNGGADPLRLAVTALLLEAAAQDGHVDPAEEETIRALLGRRYALTAGDANRLIEEARSRHGDSAQIYPFTRAVKDGMEPGEKEELLEMLWEVAYADGVLHDYEANLMRRLAGLLHVPDVESGRARKRALARLGLET